jgi:hypothetical protein
MRRKEEPRPPGGYVGDHADKLRHVRPLAHDDEERPSREDKTYGETIFNRAVVPLPRFLRRRRRDS